jgi:CRP-like cAMP-binding protein
MLYVQKGGVELSAVNEVGKEAVLAILGPGDFFGEGSMAGQAVRMGTATAITPTTTTFLPQQRCEPFQIFHPILPIPYKIKVFSVMGL